jgi:Holliday junction resolvase YEN1
LPLLTDDNSCALPVDVTSPIDEKLSCTSLLHIWQEKLGPCGPKTGANVCGFCVETATLALTEETISALNGNIQSKEMQKDHTPV